MRSRLKRLEELERRAGPPCCRACRDRRGRHVFVNARERPDGTLEYPDGAPAPCAECGEVAELVVAVVETVVNLGERGESGWV